jgi:Uncharacterized protein conserved in archaea
MEKQKLVLISGSVFVIVIIVAILAGGTGNNILNTGPGQPQGYGPGQGGVQPPQKVPGTGTGPGGNYPVLLPSENTAPLSEMEIADILFMREEEQVAHDLYIRWAGRYTLPIFSNIADSETMHIYEVQLLVDRYGLSSERIGNATAGYSSPVIQSLYDTLGPQGDASLIAALEAGLAVEERDIADLDLAIASTSRPDILQVWSNLRQGSENHKAAFLRALGR